jgi:polyferredoxin
MVFKRIVIPASVFLFLVSVSPLAAQQGSGRKAATFGSVLARPKFVTMLILGLLAMGLLLTKKMKDGIKIPLLLVATFLYGIAANLPISTFKGFSMHPSPICAATKSILYGFGMPLVVTLAVIIFLTLVGPKLFCGWVCPVGAVQELVAMLADRLKIRRIKWNFTFTQAVRIGIFLLFVFLSGTSVYHIVTDGQKSALSLYDPINAFHGFEFTAPPTFLAGFLHYLPLLLSLALAFKLYRPFCYLICPIGLLTNLLEQVAIFRVTLKKSKCDDCGVCLDKTPCPTVPEILKKSVLRPDCFSCTACGKACAGKNLMSFGVKRSE